MTSRNALDWVSAILAHIAIGPDILAALVADAKLMDKELDGERQSERTRLSRAIAASSAKLSVLTDKLASGVLDDDIYREKVAEVKSERTGFELALHALDFRSETISSLVAELAGDASRAVITFDRGDIDARRATLALVCSNLMVRDGNIVSYQWKSPFAVPRWTRKGLY